ncbi:MAG: hypothetical protein WC346_13115 [Methanogenium sp.]|jgi:hypothetical protein
MTAKAQTLEAKRAILKNTILSCPNYREIKPNIFRGTNIETTSQITIQLTGTCVKISRGGYYIRPSPYIKDVDVEKFRRHIYTIIGVQL